MAKSDAVWGIDIGQCALKALRCRPHDKDDKRLVVEAFDYIEYPKILTQPEANRDELIRDALQQFVSRNDLTGERVAIAVPGQVVWRASSNCRRSSARRFPISSSTKPASKFRSRWKT